MKWLVQGYYGFGNVGDDVLLCETIRGIRLIDAGAVIGVIADPTGTEGLKDFLGENVPDYFTHSTSRITCLRNIVSSDVFLIGGGTCFHQHGFCGFFRNVVAKMLGKKVVWLAIGADEIKGFKANLKAWLALSACDRVYVRDKTSIDLLVNKYGNKDKFVLTEDLFWVYPFGERVLAKRTLLVSWRSLDEYLCDDTQKVLTEGVALAVLNFASSHLFQEIVVVDSCGRIDAEANNLLYSRIKEQVDSSTVIVSRVEDCGSRGFLSHLSNASFVLSARMHPYLIAKSIGIPSLTVGYAKKSYSYAKYFKPLRILDIKDPSCVTSSLQSKLEDELKDPTVLINDIDMLRSKSASNFSELKEFLLLNE